MNPNKVVKTRSDPWARALLASAMRERGIDIGRAHAPYTNWARIKIGFAGYSVAMASGKVSWRPSRWSFR
jgi:hypothetical protein